jgi:hypothetical protein
MSDDLTNPTQEENPAQPPAEAKTTEPAQDMIPKSRFNEILNKLKTLEDERATELAKREQEETDRKKAQEKWQEIAEENERKLAETKPRLATAEKLEALVLQQYDEEIKKWPESVRKMAPSDDADILVKLDWKQRAQPLAMELMEDKTPVPGNGRRPSPSNPAGKGKSEDQARSEQEAWTRRQV